MPICRRTTFALLSRQNNRIRSGILKRGPSNLPAATLSFVAKVLALLSFLRPPPIADEPSANTTGALFDAIGLGAFRALKYYDRSVYELVNERPELRCARFQRRESDRQLEAARAGASGIEK